MFADYKDIRKRIKEKPKWFDCNGVPRYDDFNPNLSPNIYADEVILLEIGCQTCCKKVSVEMNYDNYSDSKPLSVLIKNKQIHYGDMVGCCPTGTTMNCDDIKILEYWKRDDKCNFVRDNLLEIDLTE